MSIVRLRTATTEADDYGDPQPLGESRAEIVGAFVAPRASQGVERDGRSGVIVGLTLFAPYATDLVYTDRVDVDGVVYEIDGEPGAWKQPWTRWEAGIEVALTRGEG